MAEQNSQPSAVEKALSVVEALLSNERLSDLSRATNLSYSTVHRILTELVANDWAYQDEDKHYRPGRRMHAFAGLLKEDAEIIRLARTHLEKLREETGKTVHFGLLKNDAVMYAAKLDGTGSYRMTSRVGGFVPLHSTGIGKAVLGAEPDERVTEVIKRTGMQKMAENTHSTLPSLLKDLAAVRRRGWAIDSGENEDHLRCVAAVVHDVTGTPIGGVSVSALEFELPVEKLEEVAVHVTTAARRISRSLGSPV